MNRMKGIGTMIAALVLATAVAFSAAGVVNAKGKRAYSEETVCCHRLEAAYVSQARDLLNGEGYRNIGITMTHFVDETGARTYIVKLHHERLEGLPKERETELFKVLTSIDFSDGEVIYEIV